MTAAAERVRPPAVASRGGRARSPAGAAVRTDPRGWLGLAVLLVVGAAALLRLGRDTGFFFDEWDFVLNRRAWDADALLLPHNQHLSVLPVLVYKLGFSTVGLEPYWPYRLVAVATQCLLVGLLFAYARTRVGDLAALAAAAVVMFFGPAWHDLLWVFQIGFLGSLAAGIGALLALDRGRAWLAGALLLVALGCSSLGVPLVVAAAVEVVLRRERRALWPVLAVPLIPYLLWFVTFRDDVPSTTGGVSADNLDALPDYVWRAATGAAGSLAGLGTGELGGLAVLVAIAALALWGLARAAARSGGPAPVPARLAGLLAAPLAFWALTALARADLNEPNASRYLLPGALWLLLVGVEAARGLYFPRPVLAVGAVAVLAVGISNLGPLRDGAGFLRDQTTAIKGALAATETAGALMPAAFQPAPVSSPQITAGAYLAAAADLGSAAYARGELPRTYQAGRVAADAALIGAYAIAPAQGRPARTGAPPALEGADGAATGVRGDCVLAEPTGDRARVRFLVPPGGAAIDPVPGDTRVAVRRWSDVFAPVTAPAAGGAPFALRIPFDEGPGPWHAEVDIDGPARICALAS